MPKRLESRSAIERPSASRGTESREAMSPREALCASFARSAKKTATFGAFCVGMQGLSGCTAFRAAFPPSSRQLLSEVAETSPDLPSKERMIAELESAIGPSYVQDGLVLHRNRRERLTSTERESLARVEGFEGSEIAPELVSEYLRARYPSAWTDASHVRSIRVAPMKRADASTSHAGEWKAVCDSSILESPSEITFNPSLFGSTHREISTSGVIAHVRDFFVSMDHEMAHAEDWRTSPELDERQSLELQYRVLRAMRAPGRPKLTYSEQVRHGGSSKLTAESLQEYFAEVLALVTRRTSPYVQDWHTWETDTAQFLEQAFAADAAQAMEQARVVHGYFAQTAPTFRPWEAARAAEDVEFRTIRAALGQRVQSLLERLEDPLLHRLAVSALQAPAEGYAPEAVARLRTSVASDAQSVPEHLRHSLQEWRRLLSVLMQMHVRTDSSQHTPYYLVHALESELIPALTQFVQMWRAIAPHDRESLRQVLVETGRVATSASSQKP